MILLISYDLISFKVFESLDCFKVYRVEDINVTVLEMLSVKRYYYYSFRAWLMGC